MVALALVLSVVSLTISIIALVHARRGALAAEARLAQVTINTPEGRG
jgi:hypothetical protein